MKKMKKAGVLVSAIATTAVCASMIAGSTFALFTSEDQVDITVKTGSVEVSSSIENAQITHATSIEKNGEEYAVSYTDAVVEEVTVSGNELALTNVIPGDIMEFDIVLSNDGTVDANYQYSLKCTEGLKLISALDVEIVNGETFVYSGSGLKSYQSKWDELNVKAEETYHVTMTLPAEAGNEYKGLTSKLVVGTYAVQYNAVVDKTAEAVIETVPEEATVYDVTTAEDLKNALNTKENSYVVLYEDITATGSNATAPLYLKENDLVLDLNGHTLTTSAIGPATYTGGRTPISVTIKNGKINSEIVGTYMGIYAAGDNNTVTLENVEVYSGGTQAVYNWSDNVIINSGNYETINYVYRSAYFNYIVDIENKQLIDINKNTYKFTEMELELVPDVGVCLKGKLAEGTVLLETASLNADGYLCCNNNIVGLNTYLLNLKDNKGGNITVYGGTFKNYNPACSKSENPTGNFVAEGYKVVYTTDDLGNFWFTVVSESEVADYVANGYIEA